MNEILLALFLLSTNATDNIQTKSIHLSTPYPSYGYYIGDIFSPSSDICPSYSLELKGQRLSIKEYKDLYKSRKDLFEYTSSSKKDFVLPLNIDIPPRKITRTLCVVYKGKVRNSKDK